MFGRTGATLVLAAAAFWLSGCGRGRESEPNTASSVQLRQITLYVPGMIDRQGIT
jgi:hypothetical protein